MIEAFFSASHSWDGKTKAGFNKLIAKKLGDFCNLQFKEKFPSLTRKDFNNVAYVIFAGWLAVWYKRHQDEVTTKQAA